MLVILIFIFILILLMEVPTLVRQKHYYALALFLVFYLAGVYLGLAQFYGWKVYNPLQALLTVLGVSTRIDLLVR